MAKSKIAVTTQNKRTQNKRTQNKRKRVTVNSRCIPNTKSNVTYGENVVHSLVTEVTDTTIVSL